MIEDMDLAVAIPNVFDYTVPYKKNKNIEILPGVILKAARPTSEKVIKIVESILTQAESEKFTHVLFDLSSGIKDELNQYCLNNSDTILLHIEEDPRNLYAARAFFDEEVGDRHFISENANISFIITKSEKENKEQFKDAFEKAISLEIGNHYPFDQKVKESIFSGKQITNNFLQGEWKKIFDKNTELIELNKQKVKNFYLGITYNGQKYEQEEAKMVEEDLLKRREQEKKTCCVNLKKVGEISQVAGSLVGRGWDIYECPTCKKVEFQTSWIS
jgi:MinD-like ATPase involved in chromosome partitioning or flagellar assembly